LAPKNDEQAMTNSRVRHDYSIHAATI